jgi:VIT1/CCC1 family predicted Fe2+/Mn2+ transporter
MEEAEVPLENLHEEIHHRAEHSGETWISWVALSTAILAVFAAIAGLLSGKNANEAMMSQIEAADHWAFYQAKGIKAAVLDAKMTLSGVPNEQDHAKAERYQEEQGHIQKEAEAKEREAKANFHQHEIFARGVTMFQIAIAIAAISALTKKRRFWVVSLVFGAIGAVFLVLGFLAH